ncbi:ThiF family adenylyltransferase [Paenibacillus methanolicus]|uniref:Adenylyltransferase/sulfurtransferase n=1 Tax=Paenibacillus methanolicus TaxID=582686 RepID=A0A5S5BRL6_9BACL|nr:ThiF family adenylyltransferase [Paenibacillus methanolicus]TYP69831.1 adenylyltransferase/sulfurtransferase [Paenibacillus methanolicus]
MHKPEEQPRWPDRYSRQTRFAPIGESGQRLLEQAGVLIVGCGALGASLAQHMARAGVGLVRIVDRDYVEPSNLQRQVLFDERDALESLPKAVAAARKLRRINGEIEVDARVLDVTKANVGELLEGMDAVLDGTDNAAARLLLSDRCFRRGIPFFYGGVAGSQGMSASLVPGATACLRCLIGGGESDSEADTCDTIGVIAPAVEWVAALQAAEALKWLSGRRDALRRTWLTGDLWNFRVRESALPSPSRGCDICGGAQAAEERGDEVPTSRVLVREAMDASGSPKISSSHAAATFNRVDAQGDGESGPNGARPQTAVLCGRDTVQVTMGESDGIDLVEAERWLAARGCEVRSNPYLVKAALPEGEKLVLFPDGRILVQGTQDPARAISLCGAYLTGMRDAAIQR